MNQNNDFLDAMSTWIELLLTVLVPASPPAYIVRSTLPRGRCFCVNHNFLHPPYSPQPRPSYCTSRWWTLSSEQFFNRRLPNAKFHLLIDWSKRENPIIVVPITTDVAFSKGNIHAKFNSVTLFAFRLNPLTRPASITDIDQFLLALINQLYLLDHFKNPPVTNSPCNTSKDAYIKWVPPWRFMFLC